MDKASSGLQTEIFILVDTRMAAELKGRHMIFNQIKLTLSITSSTMIKENK